MTLSCCYFQMSIKDWPLDEEEYRITSLPEIPDITLPLIVQPRIEKITPTITAVSKDLVKYKDAGRMTEADVAWWRHYLAVMSVEARPQPATAVQSAIPIYQIPTGNNRQVIDITLRNAINNTIACLQHVSDVRLGRQRIVL